MRRPFLILLPLFFLGGLLPAPAQDAKPKPPPQPVDIVFLGDSITKGVRSGVTAQQTFAEQVKAGLAGRGLSVSVANVGIGGERTDMALKRLERDVISRRPRIVTIMYGTNDSYVDKGKTASRIPAAAYRRNLQSLVERLRAEGIEPVLMTEPRWAVESKPNGLGNNPNTALEPYIEICREVAAAKQVTLVDHFAAWTEAFENGQNLMEWTTDGCHPNPLGHQQLAARLMPVLQTLVAAAASAAEVAAVPFEVECRSVLRRDQGTTDGSYWMHNRAAIVPAGSPGEMPMAIMVLFRHLGRSDYYSGMYTMSSDDMGASWSEPELRDELDWVSDGNINVAVADVTPNWHAPSGKLIAIGAQVRYSPEGKQLEDQPRAHQTAYAVYHPEPRTWTKWRTMAMPKGDQFNFARNACAQSLLEDDGTLLLPFYIGEGTHKPFSSTVVRARFDAASNELVYLEHGNVLELDIKRGLYEPSLARHGGRYYLTLRNDIKGYVSVSDDGLNFAVPKPWTFDDGEELGSYNTQQHWVTIGGGLFLVYTRRGADNDHVVRHRAPLFMAQVDPEKLVVMRATEQVLVPERGATLGNSGVTVVSADESWITVSEANPDRPEAKKGGGIENQVYVVKVRAMKK